MDDVVAGLLRHADLVDQAAEYEEFCVSPVLLRNAAAEIVRLRAAISGWQDHYGWKGGVYIDNVNDIFKPLLPALTVEAKHG